MRKEILVSLGDEGLKGLGEVLGNSSCVKILDLLAMKDLAVSDIARELGMRLNTCDYNVKKLVKAGLIEKSGHWWSVKGKKMPRYQVVDRRIVISPRRKVAAKFLWVLGLIGVAGVWLRGLSFKGRDVASGVVLKDAAFEAAPKMEMLTANAGARESVIGILPELSFWETLAGWEWFLLGAWTSIVLFFIFSLVSERKRI